MKKYFLALVFVVFVAATSFAQVEKGVMELNLSGALNVTSNGDSVTSFDLAVMPGYFVTKNHEIGAAFDVHKTEGFDTFGTLSGVYTLNFPKEGGKLLPFVGGHVGFGFGTDDNPTVFGFFGGIKYFVADGAAINVGPYYRRYMFDHFDDMNEYGVQWGISLFFK